jgi:flagellar biosynthetic protein FliQ
MTPADLMAIAREALLLALVISAPPVLAAAAAGVVVAIIQAATQIQEQTIGFAARAVAAIAALLAAGPFIVERLTHFTETVFVRLGGG